MLTSPHDPSEFVRETDEGYTGLDYEILRTFATAHRVRPVPEFSDLIPWLLEGRGDVIASSFSVTDERRESVDFSETYFPVRTVVVARETLEVRSPADLAGKRAAVVPGSSLEELVRNRNRIAGATLVPVARTELVYDAVLSASADFAPVDSTAALADLKTRPELTAVHTFPGRTGYGFAVPKGSDLAGALSAHVERLRDSRIFYSMLDRFFGPSALALVRSAELEK